MDTGTGTEIDAAPQRGPVVAIGNFDGLHRGHRAVVAAAGEMALRTGRPAALLTFHPHPRAFFNPAQPWFELTPPTLKAALAARLGIGETIMLPFSRALADLEAQDFLDQILGRRLDVAGVVVGHDFHFGQKRAGTPALLAAWGEANGRPVTIVAPVSEGPEPISSSIIREALGRGEVETAARLLGHEWVVRGMVGPGDKRGRELGYPTANIAVPPGFGLRHGIYAVRVHIHGEDTVRAAVASFGRRPTFDNGAPLLEVHLFDFAGDLYGRVLDVSFAAWLRPEARFADVAELVAQMDADSKAARLALAAAPSSTTAPGSPLPLPHGRLRVTEP